LLLIKLLVLSNLIHIKLLRASYTVIYHFHLLLLYLRLINSNILILNYLIIKTISIIKILNLILNCHLLDWNLWILLKLLVIIKSIHQIIILNKIVNRRLLILILHILMSIYKIWINHIKVLKSRYIALINTLSNHSSHISIQLFVVPLLIYNLLLKWIYHFIYLICLHK
jgi:hypothetical protein